MTDLELELELKQQQIQELKELINGTIRESGYFDRSTWRWEINTSSILTSLIQDAGRYCNSYASDLFIQWQERIAKKLADGSLETETQVFAFRDMGVDNIDFYKNHIQDANYYRSIWFLDTEVNENKITMCLHR